MTTYIAILRGINVSGKNKILMQDLKALFESLNFKNVKTYIQSGNVIFNAAETNKKALTEQIEVALSQSFNYSSTVLVFTDKQYEHMIEDAPENFGKYPDTYKYDIIFLKEPLRSEDVKDKILTREGVDTVYVGKSVVYLSRLIEKLSQSYLPKIISLPIYQEMSIRNWNTAKKIYELVKK